MSITLSPVPAHQKPSGRLYLSANQENIQQVTWTIVELNAISPGFTDGIENTTTHRITPGVVGFYEVKGQVAFTSVVETKRYHMGMRMNGDTYISSTTQHSSLAEELIATGSIHIYLSATDYIELMAYHAAGVNTVDIYAETFRTFMSVQRVR